MALWEIAFGAGILAVFVIFMTVLAVVSEQDSRFRRELKRPDDHGRRLA
jgi:hypothetical protein